MTLDNFIRRFRLTRFEDEIRGHFGNDVAALIENPYNLARHISGIGFKTANKIADELQIPHGSPARIEGALWAIFAEQANHGHVYVPRDHLDALAFLAGPADKVNAQVQRLVDDSAIIDEGNRLYTRELHDAETALAERLIALAERSGAPPAAAGEGPILSIEQARAVAAVGARGLVVVTGGPGTGKSTILRAVVSAWEKAGRAVKLAAPTGRAARRLVETTGRAAHTIHRLLSWRAGRFPGETVDADLVVIDESSMLDVQLAHALLAAIDPERTTLLLVGDVDQLPSVGPGYVLGDLIDAAICPVFRLTRVYRQAGGSAIVEAAHAVRGGRAPSRSSTSDQPDFFMASPLGESEDAPGENTRAWLGKLCATWIPHDFKIDPFDIQVLTPTHGGVCGTSELNEALQARLNPPRDDAREAVDRGHRRFRKGDKVIHIKNNYRVNVMNGEIGRVIDVDVEDQALAVAYDEGDHVVHYDGVGASLYELELAYALTVHKYQGCEAPAVIVCLHGAPRNMLKRNLLYTAITRARKLCVLVGFSGVIELAARDADTKRRRTMLRARLAAAHKAAGA